MNHDDLKALLEQTRTPPAGEARRQRIKQAAMTAYREAGATQAEIISDQRQGCDDSSRLTDESDISHQTKRNPQMKIPHFRTRHWMSGIAASAALVIGLFTVRHYPPHPLPTPDSSTPAAEQIAALEKQESDSVVIQARGERKPESAKAKKVAAVTVHPPASADEVKADDAQLQESLAYGAAQPAPLTDTTSALSASKVEQRSNRALPPPAALSKGRSIEPARTIRADAITPREKEVSGSQVPIIQPPAPERDRFEHIDDNPIKLVRESAVSTFSIDVDTASYSFVRRQLNAGRLPASDAVRSEELINYFDYAYQPPRYRDKPFATHVSVIDSPWRQGNQLIHIGIKGYDIAPAERPDSNLVLLLDVSGSMNSPDKLPLVKQSMGMLLDSLKATDTVAIVVYAGAAGAVLEPTPASDRAKILAALEQLRAGGSTAGGQGLALAYRLAELNFNKNAVNRIVLATDGDFNVGITGDEQLEDFVARKRESGIYLSVLGFGQGNYQDALMQRLAQNGNGVAAYIDTLSEAQKVLSHEATSALFPIAGDVKIQVEFNPARVSEYRLIGYETRMLRREDFANDKVDAGDIGAGHSVTAIYEITPTGSPSGLIEGSRYQQSYPTAEAHTGELGFLRLRYKLPGEKESRLIATPIVTAESSRVSAPTGELRREVDFSVAVAGFAQLLRGGRNTGDWSFDDVVELAQRSKGSDEYGYRTEFVQLVRKAKIASAM